MHQRFTRALVSLVVGVASSACLPPAPPPGRPTAVATPRADTTGRLERRAVASPPASPAPATAALASAAEISSTPSDGDDGPRCRIGQLFVGPVSDGGWAASHVQALEEIARETPTVDLSPRRENLPGDDEPMAERAAEELVARGAAAVFATAPDYAPALRRVAARRPSVAFLVTGSAPVVGEPQNFGHYYGAVEEPRYITGQIAGLAVEPGANIGYLAALPMAPVIRGVNAFALGVARTNPSARVHLRWTGAWFDPHAELRNAEQLLALPVRAALIAQDQHSPSAQLAAESAGALGIGQHGSTHEVAPRASLTGVAWNWGGYYRAVVEPICAGAWLSDGRLRIPRQYLDWLGSMRDGTLTLAPLNVEAIANHPRREEIQKLYLDEISRFRSGERSLATVFAGPIRDQVGQLRIPGRPDLASLFSPDARWLVENVVGQPEP